MTKPRINYPETVELKEILERQECLSLFPQVAMEDPCLLQFTSGTTGLPKGAILTHANQLYKTAAMAMVYKCGADDLMLTAMPTFHIAGMLFRLTVPLYAGGTAVVLSRYDPVATALAIQNLNCTSVRHSIHVCSNDVDAANGFSGFDFSQYSLATSFGMILTDEIMESCRNFTHGGVMVCRVTSRETHTGDTFSPLDMPLSVVSVSPNPAPT